MKPAVAIDLNSLAKAEVTRRVCIARRYLAHRALVTGAQSFYGGRCTPPRFGHFTVPGTSSGEILAASGCS
jgi:hypothetical protein